MKFDTPATDNPIDRLRVVGKPIDRIDGPLKTTGTAPYAYERHDVAPLDMPPLEKGAMNTATLFGGPDIQHYHQAIAVVVAETFEAARDAASLIRVEYARQPGRFDLAAEAPKAQPVAGDSGEGSGGPPEDRVGDFEGAFARAEGQLDATYTTPDETHAMMEPHATIAAWDGD